MLQVDYPGGVAFRAHTGKESVLLFGIYIVDECLLALEVELDGVCVILVASHLEHGLSLHASLGGRVGGAACLHVALVYVHGYAVAGEVHVLVLHLSRPVEVCHLALGVIDERVAGGVVDGCVHPTLFLACQAVEVYAVVHHLVVSPYSLLQGVHAGGVVGVWLYLVAQRVHVYGVGHGLGDVALLLFSLRVGHTGVCHHSDGHGDKRQNSYSRLFSHQK